VPSGLLRKKKKQKKTWTRVEGKTTTLQLKRGRREPTRFTEDSFGGGGGEFKKGSTVFFAREPPPGRKNQLSVNWGLEKRVNGDHS